VSPPTGGRYTIEENTAPAVEPKKKGKRAKATRRKRTSAKKSAKPAARETVRSQAIVLLQRSGGATLPELMKKFEWLPHTTRGFISILGKEYKVFSEKVDGVRTYRIK
jgi:hypothetical protein